ncbi:hypothetical protein ACW19A_05790 [Limosilactobacillus fermentum]|uniref:hypothetical protein n=1 Tax=Limosilactobacillus fermentum TaxID=1613 RepID=UPI003BA371E0
MKQFLNAAMVISFFSLIVAAIWVVWDQEGFSNAEKTTVSALIVFATALLCKLAWVVVKEL